MDRITVRFGSLAPKIRKMSKKSKDNLSEFIRKIVEKYIYEIDNQEERNIKQSRNSNK